MNVLKHSAKPIKDSSSIENRDYFKTLKSVIPVNGINKYDLLDLSLKVLNFAKESD